MDLRELYNEAITGEFKTLTLMIEIVVFEKGILTFESDKKDFQQYLNSKSNQEINQSLREYIQKVS